MAIPVPPLYYDDHTYYINAIVVSAYYGKINELGYEVAIEPIINNKTPDIVLVNKQNCDIHIIDVKTCPPKQYINVVGNKPRLSRYLEDIIHRYLNDQKLWDYIINEYLESKGAPHKIKKSCIVLVPSECIRKGYLLDDIGLINDQNMYLLMKQGKLLVAMIYNTDRDVLKVDIYKGTPNGCSLHSQLRQGLSINLESRGVIFFSRNTPLEAIACYVLPVLLWFTKYSQKYEYTLNDVDEIMEGRRWGIRPIIPPVLSHLPRKERLDKWSDVLNFAVGKGLMKRNPVKNTYSWRDLKPGSPQSTYSKTYEEIYKICNHAVKRYWWYFLG